MSTRTPLIAANWKAHFGPEGFDAADSPYRTESAVDVVVLPMFIEIQRATIAGLITGAQCGSPQPEGTRTGDVPIASLKTLGCRYVLCGHSERRQNHGETDAFIAEQAIAALEAGIHPIVCIGETKEERKAKKEKHVVEKQMKLLPSGVTIAYEPVWAINTGTSATPAQAQEMHAFIRSLLPRDLQTVTRILYGGSMNAKNAEQLLSQPDIDGGLVGAASLKPEEFRSIVAAAERLSI